MSGGGGRVDGSGAGRGGVVHGYRPMVTTGRPVWRCCRCGQSQLDSLNSTENYGRRCLTPLRPHRNYILSYILSVSLLADTRHAAAAAAAAARRPRISPSASAASQSVWRAAVPSIARAALQFPRSQLSHSDQCRTHGRVAVPSTQPRLSHLSSWATAGFGRRVTSSIGCFCTF